MMMMMITLDSDDDDDNDDHDDHDDDLGGDLVSGTARPGHQTGGDSPASLSLQLRGQRSTGCAPCEVSLWRAAHESSLSLCAL